jgi:trans-2,3-dihydro-3-hydroxyanthranilate isomerase
MLLQFQTADVFTCDRLAGNPLAVVLNADGLSAQQMQAIAAEFNLAETTFIRPPKDAAHTAEVRIFTPRSEMPFAGHPNVGTAFVLARAGTTYGRPVSGDSVIFEERAGLGPDRDFARWHGGGGRAIGFAATALGRRRDCGRTRDIGLRNFAR